MKGKMALFYVLLSLMFFLFGTACLWQFAKNREDTEPAAETLADSSESLQDQGQGKMPGQQEMQQTKAGGGAQGEATSEDAAQEEAAKEETSQKSDAVAEELPSDEALYDEEEAVVSETLATLIRQEHDKIVVLDPGHGGDDLGYTATDKDQKDQILLTEKEFALDVALRTKALLEKEDIFVIMTREGDTGEDLKQRVDRANVLPADFFVSIHLSMKDDSMLHGMSVIYNDQFYSRGYGSSDLAEQLLQSVTDKTLEAPLGIFPCEEEEEEVRLIVMPGVRLEMGCISNRQEVRLLGRDDYRQKVAEGICEGIRLAFENRQTEQTKQNTEDDTDE
ncbi:MAG: N-acetylmuramoyl-L-alanine amidase [Lachnospiraceae bacterium]|nr:N-acetylmuramoyl-L-alanine amidase [Lachnospiraceae bacterium]